MTGRERAVSSPTAASSPLRLEAARPRYGEKVIYGLLLVCALVSVVTTVGIVISLFGPTVEFFQEVPFREFFSTDTWAPTFSPGSFGVASVVAGTLSVTLWSCVVALPLGLGAAIYLREYASRRQRRILKPILEVLEGVPTVAYGFFALTFITPIIRDVWPEGFLGGPPGIFSVASAGIVLGIMIIPTVASISDDAMNAIPQGLREGAYALGSSKLQVATRVVVPAALSGIVASFVLGISRAIGETMVVLIAAGNTPNLTFLPNESVQTMTAFIGTTATGDIGVNSIEYKTIFAVGALLFLMTLVMNVVSIRLVRRFREVYE